MSINDSRIQVVAIGTSLSWLETNVDKFAIDYISYRPCVVRTVFRVTSLEVSTSQTSCAMVNVLSRLGYVRSKYDSDFRNVVRRLQLKAKRVSGIFIDI